MSKTMAGWKQRLGEGLLYFGFGLTVLLVAVLNLLPGDRIAEWIEYRIWHEKAVQVQISELSVSLIKGISSGKVMISDPVHYDFPVAVLDRTRLGIEPSVFLKGRLGVGADAYLYRGKIDAEAQFFPFFSPDQCDLTWDISDVDAGQTAWLQSLNLGLGGIIAGNGTANIDLDTGNISRAAGSLYLTKGSATVNSSYTGEFKVSGAKMQCFFKVKDSMLILERTSLLAPGISGSVDGSVRLAANSRDMRLNLKARLQLDPARMEGKINPRLKRLLGDGQIFNLKIGGSVASPRVDFQ